jgi:hypothetical protein
MGLRAERLQWSDLGVAAMRFVYLLQGLETPKNPTTGYGVIAMGLEERTSDRPPFRFYPHITESLPLFPELT